MIGIVIVLIELLVITSVLIIHESNKYFTWYFYRSFNVTKHVLQKNFKWIFYNHFWNNLLIFCTFYFKFDKKEHAYLSN